jgi:DNA-binding NtrC family response regulator
MQEENKALVVSTVKSMPYILNDLENDHLNASMCGSFHEAITAMHHGKFAVIVLDPQAVNVDALEFVLNARDFDAEVPIVIMGKSKRTSTNGVLSHMSRVFWLPKGERGIVKELKNIIHGK